MKSLLKTHPLLKIVNNALVDLPSPSSISLWWNLGSLLGLCLVIQLLSGLFLAMHYVSDILLAFDSVSHISRDVNSGWMLRMLHANGASLFFICLYLHTGRGIYYSSYRLHMVWSVGVVIFLMIMAAAFLGYVLPWGQMSFWGATVITNLFSAIPYIGSDIVSFLWGGFAVDNATLTRFFALHFLVPFLVTAFIGIHLLFLHQTGSNNPLGLSLNMDKKPFHPYFSNKDLLGYSISVFVLIMFILINPWGLGDPENFIPANPLVTPIHIQPEWYFLFAYAILRSIPNKLGGVMALVMSILILLIMPFYPYFKMLNCVYSPITKMLFWILCCIIILLTWIGARPVEDPYIIIGQILTIMYFSSYIMIPSISLIWDSLTN